MPPTVSGGGGGGEGVVVDGVVVGVSWSDGS